MSTNPDLCHEFARVIAETRYENIPDAAIDAAKKSILDTVGVILGASGVEPAARSVLETVERGGGRTEATILGFGARTAAPMAAFANGAMAHSLDFDDRTPWGAHPTGSALPAALALAERNGPVSGRTMIAAVAIAQDLFVRLRRSIEWRHDWNPSTVFGAFSATAAAGYVLGLGRKQAADALGIASMHSSGTMEMIFGVGSDLRGLYAGFMARDAVFAAELAHNGIGGIDSLFEGKAGIFNTYFGGKYDRATIMDGLGDEYLGARMLYKPWPVVGVTHTYIHAVIQLMTQHGLRAEDIAEIRAYVGDFHQRMCEPLETRRAPATAVDAKFSLPFALALAATHGDVSITDFTPTALKDPAVLAMARKVIPVEDKSLDWKNAPPDGRVEIATRDGRMLVGVGRNVPGSPEAPMTWDDLGRKFRSCARAAAIPVPPGRSDKVAEMGRRLETLSDVTELIRAIA